MTTSPISATIKLFLPYGDAKRLRTCEVSNWTGKALAAPRTDVDALLKRDETQSSGVYFLFGADPSSGNEMAYIGEAEVIKDRLRQHRTKEFWNAAVIFVSKDENLTKAHIRYLESRLIAEASQVGRYELDNSNASSAKLPESDREDMEVFLSRIRQVLPVLGFDILTPKGGSSGKDDNREVLVCAMKGAKALGIPTESGFVVFKGSTAVLAERSSAATQHPYVVEMRRKLVESGVLVPKGEFLVFTKDTEFTSPSAAAGIIHGGGANGLISWKNKAGLTLKELEVS